MMTGSPSSEKWLGRMDGLDIRTQWLVEADANLRFGGDVFEFNHVPTELRHIHSTENDAARDVIGNASALVEPHEHVLGGNLSGLVENPAEVSSCRFVLETVGR